MAPKNREHITFIIDQEVYYYKFMPFGLKNVKVTYQRMVNKMFKYQIGRNMELCVDDMIVKSKLTDAHLVDLAETFQTLKKFDMWLNPTKCAFRVNFGKFLGFIIHQRGIDANPEKVQAIIDMLPPRSIKEVQHLRQG